MTVLDSATFRRCVAFSTDQMMRIAANREIVVKFQVRQIASNVRSL